MNPQQDPQNPPKVEKLAPEIVPLAQLGHSTADMPIPEDRLRIHAAVVARALREQKRERD
jgi:hypothetical protein